MEQKKNSTINKEEQTAADEATIFDETAHIRDRDEMMLDGNRIVQGGSATDIDDEWDPSDGDRLTGTADYSTEAVDAQIEQSSRIAQDIRQTKDHRQPTVAKPMDDDDHFEDMSDDELMKYADVLGIPERHDVPRMKLIVLIRSQTRAGL